MIARSIYETTSTNHSPPVTSVHEPFPSGKPDISINLKKSKKIGIRTVRDILGLPYLIGESEGDPKIDLKMYPPNEEINETLVSLFIPKQYLS